MTKVLIAVLAVFLVAGCTPIVSEPIDTQLVGIACTSEQKATEACTREYMPVCGYDADGTQLGTFGNTCTACAEPAVASFEDGECRVACTAEQIAMQGELVACTMEYRPVCGYDAENNQLQTFGNACAACSTVGVIEYEEGEC